ncbi:hypothetical protein FDO65_10260 [Nakamurella flava]|uniref:DUF4307 domain-containing protein n=1 Tax=Nakamurella flava TaxID=2576308 RepID=A0A4U6QNW9_9ACTN|nr:hypothetical protein [Nakamurella flava]TKV61898.1 hypothetical protein FDO65_10260 [Nakamurella flava]
MADDDVELTKSEQRARKRRERAEADAALSAPARALKWLIMGVVAAAVLVFAIYLGSNHRKVGFHVESSTPYPQLGITSYQVSVESWKSDDAEDIVQAVYERAGSRPVGVDIYCRDTAGKVGVRLASGTQTSGTNQELVNVRDDDAC